MGTKKKKSLEISYSTVQSSFPYTRPQLENTVTCANLCNNAQYSGSVSLFQRFKLFPENLQDVNCLKFVFNYESTYLVVCW